MWGAARARGIQKARNAPGMTDYAVGGKNYTEDQARIRAEANAQRAALEDPNSAFSKSYADREAGLKEQYANVRKSFDAQKGALQSDYDRQLARQQAVGGMAGGGAAMKMSSKNLQGLGETYGSLEAGVSGEEAAAREALAGQKSAEKLARENAIQAGEQFGQTLKFQEGSFADQMRYSWNEFSENQKTNLVNTLALLKDSGFLDKNMDELMNFWESGFAELYTNTPKQGRFSNPFIEGTWNVR